MKKKLTWIERIVCGEIISGEVSKTVAWYEAHRIWVNCGKNSRGDGELLDCGSDCFPIDRLVLKLAVSSLCTFKYKRRFRMFRKKIVVEFNKFT